MDMIKTENIAISKLEKNTGQISGLPKNPRFIRDERFELLKKSIQESPEMLNLRELIVYPNGDKFVIVAGNMRFSALKDLGHKDAPCKILPENTTVEKLKEYTIKDNAGFGQNDFDALANEWDMSQLLDWGVELPAVEQIEDSIGDENSVYSEKTDAPQYEIKGDLPDIKSLIQTEKSKSLIDRIKSKKLDDELESFLISAAYRHMVFDYAKIAEYYAHQPKEVQELFEESALVIIDYEDAIKHGFTSLNEEIEEAVYE